MTTESDILDVVRSRRIGILTHGIEGAVGPAEQLFDYLVDELGVACASYCRYPLDARNHRAPVVRLVCSGGSYRVRSELQRRIEPPVSYLMDIVERWPRNCDVWIAFDPLLALKAACWPGRKRRCVVSWHVDFAPDRGSWVANRAYKLIDRTSYDRCDIQVDISRPAREARQHVHGNRSVSHIVVPFATSPNGNARASLALRRGRTVAFAGALEHRTGAHNLPEIAAGVLKEMPDVKFVIIGEGSLRLAIEKELATRGLIDNVQMLGFIESHESLLAELVLCDIALAPYDPAHAGFSKYSDPGKVKTYLSCGLPVLASEVITNASEIVKSGAGVTIPGSRPEDWSRRVLSMLRNTGELQARSMAALTLAESYAPSLVYEQFALELGASLMGDHLDFHAGYK
jgi:glycosyltransferase involved in cell wall biosynthesis